jgi:hypothetical protein
MSLEPKFQLGGVSQIPRSGSKIVLIERFYVNCRIGNLNSAITLYIEYLRQGAMDCVDQLSGLRARLRTGAVRVAARKVQRSSYACSVPHYQRRG